MNFKVYGEERSATTYLERLIQKNTDLQIIPNDDHPEENWKHGFPKYTEDTVQLFLIRDLYQWLRSVMTHNGRRFTKLRGVFGDSWENVLECRYEKVMSYIDFILEYGGILLKTEYLQDNPQIIADLLDIDQFKDITKHLGLDIDARNNPNRIMLTDSQKQWIETNKNTPVEQFIDNLTVYNV